MVEISDYVELLAVHRVFAELKWIEEPNDPAIIGSPFVANVASRVLQALIEHERKQGNLEAVRGWEEWRELDESRQAWNQVRRQIQLTIEWSHMGVNDKREYVRNIASPYTIAPEKLENLIAEGDEFHSEAG